MAFDVEEWRKYRAKMNQRILSEDDLSLKRFMAVDNDVYKAGALDVRTKELMGLVASLVLRCDDCVRYHVERCMEEGVSAAEMTEAITVAMVVGGSVTIPHVRRAFEAIDAFSSGGPSRPSTRSPPDETYDDRDHNEYERCEPEVARPISPCHLRSELELERFQEVVPKFILGIFADYDTVRGVIPQSLFGIERDPV